MVCAAGYLPTSLSTKPRTSPRSFAQESPSTTLPAAPSTQATPSQLQELLFLSLHLLERSALVVLQAEAVLTLVKIFSS